MTRDQSAVKVDIDAGDPPTIRTVTRLLRRAGYKPVAMTTNRSPGGNGWHVVVHVSPRPKSPYEVIALTLILGGDVNREAMQMHRARGFFRVRGWMRDAWNVLYVPHPNRQRHVTWRE
jgi:hypothetical protein